MMIDIFQLRYDFFKKSFLAQNFQIEFYHNIISKGIVFFIQESLSSNQRECTDVPQNLDKKFICSKNDAKNM